VSAETTRDGYEGVIYSVEVVKAVNKVVVGRITNLEYDLNVITLELFVC
jgi:hypothetical protein